MSSEAEIIVFAISTQGRTTSVRYVYTVLVALTATIAGSCEGWGGGGSYSKGVGVCLLEVLRQVGKEILFVCLFVRTFVACLFTKRDDR